MTVLTSIPIQKTVEKSLCISLAAFLAASLLLSGGCESVPARQQIITSTAKTAPTTTLAPEHSPEIDQLLDEAISAFDANRLTTPLDDNAYYRFLRVLSIDPGNAAADQGIADIVEKYLEWAINAAENSDFRKARDYLNKGRSVDESHPNIIAVEKLISARSVASRMTYHLSPEALKGRTHWLVEELKGIAHQIEVREATVIITARNDSEGRWIYQQLNSATDRRVRATFEPGNIPSVRLVYR